MFFRGNASTETERFVDADHRSHRIELRCFTTERSQVIAMCEAAPITNQAAALGVAHGTQQDLGNRLTVLSGSGQLAGASVSDKMLNDAIDGVNRTRTSQWDEMSYAQREMVMRKVESMMSNSDALNYVSMSAEDRMEFVQAMYLTEPELYAPGIGAAGNEEMLEVLKNPELLKDPDKAKRASIMRGLMTTEDRADLALGYQKWMSQSGKSSVDMGMLSGQLASAKTLDKGLQSLLDGETPDHRQEKQMGYRSNKQDPVESEQEKRRKLEEKNTQRVEKMLDNDERATYDKLTGAKKADFLKVVEQKAELEADYMRGKMDRETFKKRETEFRRLLTNTYGVNYADGIIKPW